MTSAAGKAPRAQSRRESPEQTRSVCWVWGQPPRSIHRPCFPQPAAKVCSGRLWCLTHSLTALAAPNGRFNASYSQGENGVCRAIFISHRLLMFVRLGHKTVNFGSHESLITPSLGYSWCCMIEGLYLLKCTLNAWKLLFHLIFLE